MELKQKLINIVEKSGRGYLDQSLYISRIFNAIFPDGLEPEMVEKIGHLLWAMYQLEGYSGSSVDIGFDELPKILARDYSSKAYKERWYEIESMYRRKDWYLGMIAQLEAEEYVNGQSEV